MIEQRVGVLGLLDEECKLPKTTDTTLLQKFHSSLGTHDNYEVPRRAQNSSFIVKHYAGEVMALSTVENSSS